MSKAKALDALFESAISNFSLRGYSGASLREIARDAGVPLSAIHFYFSSKSDLFRAVRSYAWKEIDDDRHALLDQLESREGGAELSDVVRALASPIVSRAFSESPRDRDLIFVIRSFMAFSGPNSDPRVSEAADRTALRWIDAIMKCCPSLSREDSIWAFSFILGAIYSWQLIDHRYDRIIGAGSSHSIDRVSEDIVVFCSSGIRGMVGLRATPP